MRSRARRPSPASWRAWTRQPSPPGRRWPSCRSRASTSCWSCRRNIAARAAACLAASAPSASAKPCRAFLPARARSTSPKAPARDYWRMARAMFAAGFRPGELIHNSFSYHFVPAGSMMETGAHALGCTVFPGGTGQTEQQVQAMAELQPAGYIGTPSFLQDHCREGRRNGRGPAQREQGHVRRRGLPAQPARLVRCARHRRLPVLCHRRPGPDRLRNPGARRPGAGRRA